MPRPCRRLLVLLPLLLPALGCGNRAALTYNNALAGITKELEAAGKSFSDDLQRNAANPAKLDGLHADIVSKVKAITTRGRALSPPNTAEGLAVHQAFLSYMDVEDDIAANDLAKVVTLLKQNHQIGLQDTLDRITQRENEKLDALKRAQQEFARANQIKLQ
jgi:hypothetical protein